LLVLDDARSADHQPAYTRIGNGFDSDLIIGEKMMGLNHYYGSGGSYQSAGASHESSDDDSVGEPLRMRITRGYYVY